MLLDLAVVGQPSIFLARSLAVGLASLSLCGLLLSTLSVSSTHYFAYCLCPLLALLMRWEAPHTDREMNLEMEHLQHRVQAGVKLWIVLEQKEVLDESEDKTHQYMGWMFQMVWTPTENLCS